ncbi:hypothetical protein LPB144_02790 [Christiangramia salexigens]|uniref:histidine kinase n=2 Tax=Christiangramia salexigens TaxID=1913577 RepID=A0A1L3J2Q3_9FLAO|nr:hypothetical protein LPB144_02790 [Christiangramia salexigens]
MLSLIREHSEAFEFSQYHGLDGFLIYTESTPHKIWLNPKLRSVLGFENQNIDEFFDCSEIFEYENLDVLGAQTSKEDEKDANVYLRHKRGHQILMSFKSLTFNNSSDVFTLIAFKKLRVKSNLTNKLLKKLNRYEKLIEGTNLGAWQWNIQTGDTVFNEYWAEILGYKLKQLQPTSVDTWQQFAHPEDQEKCNALLEDHFSGKTEYYICEARMKHKNGRWIWVRDKGKVVSWTPDGKPEWMTGFHEDITEEKERLEIKKLFIDQAPTAIAMLDKDMRYIAASDRWMLDYNIQGRDIIGKSHYDIFPEIGEEWKKIHQECLHGVIHSREEDYFKREDGTETWLKWEVRPWYTNERAIGGITMHTEDITKIKIAEKENYEKQQLMETVFDSINVGIIACDKNGSLTLFNSTTKKWHGLPAKPIPQNELSSYYGLYHTDGKTQLKTEEIPLLKTLKYCAVENEEIIIKPKTAKEILVSVNGSQLLDEKGNVTGAVVAMHDITERITAENKLRISEETFRGSFEHSAIGIALLDPQGRWLEVNKRLCEIVGYSEKELKQLTFQEITHPDDLNDDIKLLEELVAGKREYYHMDKRYFHKNGDVVYINLAVSLVKNEENKPLYFVSQITDITKQKIAEQKLKKALAQLEGILEASTQVSIIGVDPDGIINEFNKGAENLLGYSKTEMIGNQTPVIIHLEKEMDARRKELKKKYGNSVEGFGLFKTLAEKSPHDTQYWTYRHKNGSLFPVQLTITSIRSEDEIVGYLGVATDITNLKAAEQEISNILKLTEDQNDRLKNFAHIVSHNLRSHSGNLGMLLDLYVEDHPEQKSNQIIEMLYRASGNLKETIDHLNEVTVINTTISEKATAINLHAEIKKAVESVNALVIDADLEVTNDVPSNLTVYGVPAYMESVLLNFTTNAIKYRSLDRQSRLKFSVKESKKYIRLIIEDNGLGIDLKKHRQKLFGMYKTFHNHKDSRGVGLFITKNQIEAMGGTVDVESEVNKGTSFIIKLKKYEKN